MTLAQPGLIKRVTFSYEKVASCENVAHSDAESFSSTVNDGWRILVAAFASTPPENGVGELHLAGRADDG